MTEEEKRIIFIMGLLYSTILFTYALTFLFIHVGLAAKEINVPLMIILSIIGIIGITLTLSKIISHSKEGDDK